MSRRVHVDPDQLRRGGQSLQQANVERWSPPPAPGSLGAPGSMGAFERFDGYWQPALSTVGESVDALRTALVSAADVYERRDAESAAAFGFEAPRAF